MPDQINPQAILTNVSTTANNLQIGVAQLHQTITDLVTHISNLTRQLDLAHAQIDASTPSAPLTAVPEPEVTP